MEIVFDEDVPRAFAAEFTGRGFAVIHLRDTELRGASDEAVFRFAAERGALLLTGDLGFTNQHRFDLSRIVGLIVNRLPQGISLPERVRELRRLLAAVEASAFTGHITILEAGKMRRRPILGL